MSDLQPKYRAIALAARPPRLATFVPVKERWQWSALRMLENYSRMWGGAANILVPALADGCIPDVFRRILRQFDPDYLAVYQQTRIDQKLADRPAFDDWLDKSVEAYAKNNPDVSKQEAGRMILQAATSPGPGYWEPAADLNEYLMRYLATSPASGRVFEAIFRADGQSPRCATDLAELRFTHGHDLNYFDTSALDQRLALMLAMRCGGVAPEFASQLHEMNIVGRRTPIDDTQYEDVLDIHWNGNTEITRRKTGGAKFVLQRTPLGNSALGCPNWYPPELRDFHEAPAAIVIGDTAQDYYLAMAFQRLFDRGVWLPLEFVAGEEALAQDITYWVRRQLAFSLRNPNPRLKFYFTSLSLSRAEVEDAIAKLHLDRARRPSSFSHPHVVCAPNDVPVDFIARMADKRGLRPTRYEPFQNDRLVGNLDSPIPAEVSVQPLEALRWIIDCYVQEYRLPIRSKLSEIVSDGNPAGGVRPSSAGISYSSEPFLAFSGQSLEHRVRRPRIRLPQAIDVFSELLKDHYRIEPSDKGRFMSSAIDLWGDLDALAGTMADAQQLELLQRFVSKKKGENIRVSSSDRGYLSFVQIAEILGNDKQEAVGIVDRYIQKSILTRGIILHCKRCRCAAWYANGEFDEAFQCKRCRTKSLITSANWKKPPQGPDWYYELNEVVCQILDHNEIGPILSLYALKKDAKAFDFAAELEVWAGGEKPLCEIDIWAIIDGRIVLGEAKTGKATGLTKRKLRQFRAVAQAVTADEFVFATTTNDWPTETKQLIGECFDGSCIGIRYMEGLLGSGITGG